MTGYATVLVYTANGSIGAQCARGAGSYGNDRLA